MERVASVAGGCAIMIKRFIKGCGVNGSTAVSKTVSTGSNPVTPATLIHGDSP